MTLDHKKDGTFKPTHGLSLDPLYNIFKAMHDRCENPKNQAYKRYGGRGITVCNEWSLGNIENFMSWANNNGWEKGLQIDRIDNNKGYSPENCRFVTAKQNSRNRKSNHYVMVFGEQMLLTEAFERYAVCSRKTFESRIYGSKWPIEKALLEPVKKKNITKGLYEIWLLDI